MGLNIFSLSLENDLNLFLVFDFRFKNELKYFGFQVLSLRRVHIYFVLRVSDLKKVKINFDYKVWMLLKIIYVQNLGFKNVLIVSGFVSLKSVKWTKIMYTFVKKNKKIKWLF